MALFFVKTVITQHWVYQKNHYPFISMNFNNFDAILTRIYSQFWFPMQNEKFTTAARLALSSKYGTKIGSCSVKFCRILKFPPHFDAICLTNLNLFSKSESEVDAYMYVQKTFFCAVADLTLRCFCYDKARELKFAELAVHVHTKTRWKFCSKSLFRLRYLVLKSMHTSTNKKRFLALSPTVLKFF